MEGKALKIDAEEKEGADLPQRTQRPSELTEESLRTEIVDDEGAKRLSGCSGYFI